MNMENQVNSPRKTFRVPVENLDLLHTQIDVDPVLAGGEVPASLVSGGLS